ncbi:MAG: hypothetical protein LW650_02450 [Planctomycetaceae bacterium]|jgi:GH15 family glucan-1,4-alpha-glucosidase|nr:hypothetical protein [Phycisphaerales bacterium]MCE2652385.1 hypothetical protein [Planctomycetaceae bacterium]
MMEVFRCFGLTAAAMVFMADAAIAQPSSVEHDPSGTVFGEPSSIRGRTPVQPREEETVTLNFRVGFQFTYDRVAVYYTTDGSEPQGAFGVGSGTTQVLTNTGGGVQFIRNENAGGVRDWWRAVIPTGRNYQQNVRYKVSAWRSFVGNEVFASSPQGVAGFAYINKLAWPGQGSNFFPADDIGYPPVHHWKEEGIIGNNWINQMVDQNGTVFDVYYPGAGGVQGVGTKNEGYVDGLDTFPAGLPLDNRGQMHVNQFMPGIRVDGVTYWLSNQNGSDFTGVQQSYVDRTNTIRTEQRLVARGNNIRLVQYDFAPKGVNYALNSGGQPLRGVSIKRMLLTNDGTAPKTVNVYYYGDWALNGGDEFDNAFIDDDRGVMYAIDNTFRIATATGSIGLGQEYNPTTFSGYAKNVTVGLGVAMKTSPTVGAAGGQAATDFWRDTSGDNSQGWVGQQITLAPGQTREVSFAIIGGYDNFAGANGTYGFQMAPVADWFLASSAEQLMNQTDSHWRTWLDNGVTVSLPDQRLVTLFERGLLATALHFDERNGGLIAGYRNGAYPYVWPRDMAWAGVTLARTGHTDIVRQMTRYLRDVTFRDFEGWGRKGFWRQKYSTDGFVIWGAPQVDETAVIPWMVNYKYLVTGDLGYLTEAQPGNPANTTYEMVKDAAIAMSQTSTQDPGRLNLRQAYLGAPANEVLMYSNNIWEDQYDTFIYSNANIIRGLRDARAIADTLGRPADAADFQNRENGLLPGFFGKLNWNRENTDISLLGIVYPFEVVQPNDPHAVRVIDRINGVAPDANGQTKPLVRFAGQFINDSSDFVGLIDRYYGDSYWGNPALGPTRAGPWFLSTMWYGIYYAMRQDFTPGKADIDNHLYRLNRTADHNGPLGLGAEQMAPSNSLLYPGQSDFTLQTAWPNAWESMSFYVDSLMMLVDYKPDAPGNTLRVEPKLPTGWSSMTFNNLRVGEKRINLTASEDARGATHIFTNTLGGAANFDTVVRVPAGFAPCDVRVTGGTITFQSYDAATGRQTVRGTLNPAIGGVTEVRVSTQCACSVADVVAVGGLPPADGILTGDDFVAFINAFASGDLLADIVEVGGLPPADGLITGDDFVAFVNAFAAGCP